MQAVTTEYTIRVLVRQELPGGRMELPEEVRARRICETVRQALSSRTGGNVFVYPVRSREVERRSRDGQMETENRKPEDGMPEENREQSRDREAGYRGKKRWEVHHRILGTKILYARDRHMAMCTACRIWGIRPEEQEGKVMVEQWRDEE